MCDTLSQRVFYAPQAAAGLIVAAAALVALLTWNGQRLTWAILLAAVQPLVVGLGVASLWGWDQSVLPAGLPRFVASNLL